MKGSTSRKKQKTGEGLSPRTLESIKAILESSDSFDSFEKSFRDFSKKWNAIQPRPSNKEGQNRGTPDDLIQDLYKVWNLRFVLDIASEKGLSIWTEDGSVVPYFCEPGRLEEMDNHCISEDGTNVGEIFKAWTNKLVLPQVEEKSLAVWCNPPFSMCDEFFFTATELYKRAKLAKESLTTVLLTPANIGTVYYYNHVQSFLDRNDPGVFVRVLKPRLKFKGFDQTFPKDCMLTWYTTDPNQISLANGQNFGVWDRVKREG